MFCHKTQSNKNIVGTWSSNSLFCVRLLLVSPQRQNRALFGTVSGRAKPLLYCYNEKPLSYINVQYQSQVWAHALVYGKRKSLFQFETLTKAREAYTAGPR